jgi:hypothetical protein
MSLPVATSISRTSDCITAACRELENYSNICTGLEIYVLQPLDSKAFMPSSTFKPSPASTRKLDISDPALQVAVAANKSKVDYGM